MNIRELIKNFIIQYFICYTGTMFATLLLCSVSHPSIAFSLSSLWQIAFFALCADLPFVVYCSKKELSRKSWWIRTAVHTVLLEFILLLVGAKFEMYSGFWGGIIFFFIVLAVDLFVRMISYINDKGTADEINEHLKLRRKSVN